MPSLMYAMEELYNPLDLAESVIMDRDWVFERTAEGELIADVNGNWSKYHLWLNWQEEAGGLTIACSLDAKFPKPMLFKIHSLLAMVNEKLWLGHFDVSSEDMTITFRHSMLLRDGVGTSSEHLNELIDIAISECERFYPAFQSVVWGGKSPADALALALFETVAEA